MLCISTARLLAGPPSPPMLQSRPRLRAFSRALLAIERSLVTSATPLDCPPGACGLYTPSQRLLSPNKLALAPMTRNRADPLTGVPDEATAQYYAQRAGAGLLFTESIQPSAEGQGYARTPGLYTSEHAQAWARVNAAVATSAAAAAHANYLLNSNNSRNETDIFFTQQQEQEQREAEAQEEAAAAPSLSSLLKSLSSNNKNNNSNLNDATAASSNASHSVPPPAVIAQLMHCGRAAHSRNRPTVGAPPVAPSAIALPCTGRGGGIWTDAAGLQPCDAPRALETGEVPQIAEEFYNGTAEEA